MCVCICVCVPAPANPPPPPCGGGMWGYVWVCGGMWWVCGIVGWTWWTHSTLSIWVLPHSADRNFLSSGRAPTPTTSDSWQRTSCALVLLCQETSFAPNLVWHLLPNHIGSGAPAPLGLSSLPLRYIHPYHSMFEFHFILLHSIPTYASTCCLRSLVDQGSWRFHGDWARAIWCLRSNILVLWRNQDLQLLRLKLQAPWLWIVGLMITNDSFIALFDGQPQSYQEWRKRINIYHLKMKLQKRSAESILNIIGSLQGTAWRLVENCNLAKIDGDSAFDDLMKTLDKAFQYDARVRLPQDFDGYFSHLSRKPGETLLSFITNHDEKLRKIEEHGIKIPDEVPGWL